MYKEDIRSPYIEKLLSNGAGKKYYFWKYFIDKGKVSVYATSHLVTMSNFRGELSMIKSVLDSFYGSDRWDFNFSYSNNLLVLKGFIIHYPELEIVSTNSSYVKKDFFLDCSFTVDNSKIKISVITGFSTTFSLRDHKSRNSNVSEFYIHSHLQKASTDTLKEPRHFCWGSDTEGTFISSFALKDQTRMELEMFFISLDNFVKQENPEDCFNSISNNRGLSTTSSLIDYYTREKDFSASYDRVVQENLELFIGALKPCDFIYNSGKIEMCLTEDTKEYLKMLMLTLVTDSILVYKEPTSSTIYTKENYLKYEAENVAGGDDVIYKKELGTFKLIFCGSLYPFTMEQQSTPMERIPLTSFTLDNEELYSKIITNLKIKINEYVNKRQNNRLIEKRKSLIDYNRQGI